MVNVTLRSGTFTKLFSCSSSIFSNNNTQLSTWISAVLSRDVIKQVFKSLVKLFSSFLTYHYYSVQKSNAIESKWILKPWLQAYKGQTVSAIQIDLWNPVGSRWSRADLSRGCWIKAVNGKKKIIKSLLQEEKELNEIKIHFQKGFMWHFSQQMAWLL